MWLVFSHSSPLQMWKPNEVRVEKSVFVSSISESQGSVTFTADDKKKWRDSGTGCINHLQMGSLEENKYVVWF